MNLPWKDSGRSLNDAVPRRLADLPGRHGSACQMDAVQVHHVRKGALLIPDWLGEHDPCRPCLVASKSPAFSRWCGTSRSHLPYAPRRI